MRDAILWTGQKVPQLRSQELSERSKADSQAEGMSPSLKASLGKLCPDLSISTCEMGAWAPIDSSLMREESKAGKGREQYRWSCRFWGAGMAGAEQWESRWEPARKQPIKQKAWKILDFPFQSSLWITQCHPLHLTGVETE